MLRVITLVRFRAGLDPAEAFAQWMAHIDTWTRRDHPEIVSTRLVRLAERTDTGFDGFAETIWQGRDDFQRAHAWHGGREACLFGNDQARFLDMTRTSVVVEDSIIDGSMSGIRDVD